MKVLEKCWSEYHDHGKLIHLVFEEEQHSVEMPLFQELYVNLTSS